MSRNRNSGKQSDKPAAKGSTEEVSQLIGSPAVLDEQAPATDEQVPTDEQAPATAELVGPPAPATEEQVAPAPLAAGNYWAKEPGTGRPVEFIVVVDEQGVRSVAVGQVMELPSTPQGSAESVTAAIKFATELIEKDKPSKVHLVRKVALFDKNLARKQVLEVVHAVAKDVADATVFTQFQVARKTGKA